MSTKKSFSMAPQTAKTVEEFIKGPQAPTPAPAATPAKIHQAEEQVQESVKEPVSEVRPVGRPRVQNKKQRSVHMNETIRKQAEHYRIEHNLSMSTLIEQALTEYMERHP
jgi:hypothetical protein